MVWNYPRRTKRSASISAAGLSSMPVSTAPTIRSHLPTSTSRTETASISAALVCVSTARCTNSMSSRSSTISSTPSVRTLGLELQTFPLPLLLMRGGNSRKFRSSATSALVTKRKRSASSTWSAVDFYHLWNDLITKTHSMEVRSTGLHPVSPHSTNLPMTRRRGISVSISRRTTSSRSMRGTTITQ